MPSDTHESLKQEVAEAVEVAAIALINASELGDSERYMRELDAVASEIHTLYSRCTFAVVADEFPANGINSI
ncbi:MAG: hypothetical protein ACRBHB_10225 [Arenicella sp.]